MNKKLAAVLAATCVLGATTAFAANPFSDVTPSDWAYQAVAQLAAEGVIDGYPDGTFKGERNITRYEMAQMVARAMAREDQVDAQQQAQIDRLANEFANELNSLGVRVSNLESRVGNVKVTGDARVRWMDQNDSDKFDMRARLQFGAKVSENTKAVARVTTGNFRIDSEGKDADITLDRLYVEHNWNGFDITGGRYGEKLGETGYWYDDNVDGVKVGYKKDAVTAMVGYGNFREIKLTQVASPISLATEKEDYVALKKNANEAYNAYQAEMNADDSNPDLQKAAFKKWTAAEQAVINYRTKNMYNSDEQKLVAKATEATYGVLGYQGKNFHLQATYLAPNGKNVTYNNLDSVWGVGGALVATDKVKVSGDYFSVEGKGARKDADFWVARVDFGKANLKKPGTWTVYVDYVNADKGAYFGGSSSMRTKSLLDNTKSWGVGAGVVVAENVKLEAFRSFNAETQDGKDVDDLTRIQVSYKF